MEPTQRDLKNGAEKVSQYAADKTRQGAGAIEKAGDSISAQIGGVDLSETYKVVQDKASDALDMTTDFIQEHPFYSLLGAAALGFVAGSLLRRQ
jgi:ElaB/YqjD/DUF883 family membrane-anchored ribosome-binding protein